MMNRREMILGAAAIPLIPLAAQADTMLTYTPGLVADRLAAGETVLVDFSATWCSTCRAQGRVIEDLRSTNAAYDTAITFVRVDWDDYGRSDFAQSLSVPRRSTLILLRGDAELGRIVANTRSADIQALLDRALTA
jgi:thiol-disulfide isomerase/thioredoxin